MSIYIFGYGSLINKRSAKKTCDIKGELIPVNVCGFRRQFTTVCSQMGMTALGLLKEENALTNGVLFQVCDNCDFDKLDIREHGYSRELIENSQISSYASSTGDEFLLNKNDRVYVYIPNQTVIPTSKFPITKSYLDICIEGCLDFGEDFIKCFLVNTLFNGKMFDDRSIFYSKRVYSVPNNKSNLLDSYYANYITLD